MAALDRTIGRVSMSRLVLGALGVLLLWSFALSAAGVLPFEPAALAATVAVLGASTALASVGYARLFGAHAHVESGLITALLLAFLLWPSTDPFQLAAFALSAVAASASKFLLTFRGRHLFNPAAVGVLVVTVLALTGGVWWMATAAMLPLVAVAVTALEYAFISTPLVFLAGFMATEPLTLPPLRRQRLLVAAVVGIIVALPTIVTVHLGPVGLTPEMALLTGNLVALLIAPARAVALEFRGARVIGGAVRPADARMVELTFGTDRPLDFRPGQYLELTVPHRGADARGTRRVFLIASAPGDDLVRLATTVPADPDAVSSFKRAVLALPAGTPLRASRVAGDFLLPADRSVPLLLVAGGIGITPLLSQLSEIDGRDVVLVYAVSGAESLAFRDELVSSGVRVVVVSPEPIDDIPAGWVSVAGRIDADTLRAAVPDVAQRRTLVAGSPGMVGATRDALRSLGTRRVVVDAFTGS